MVIVLWHSRFGVNNIGKGYSSIFIILYCLIRCTFDLISLFFIFYMFSNVMKSNLVQLIVKQQRILTQICGEE